MSFNIDSVFELAYLIFDAYISKSNISYEKMGSLINKFKLVSFVKENEDNLNSMGILGCVEEIEEYIKETGDRGNDA